jgi:hypothetical protein
LSQQPTVEVPQRAPSWNFLGFNFTTAELEEYYQNRSPQNVVCQNPSCKTKARTSSKLNGKFLCPPCWYREKHKEHALRKMREFYYCMDCSKAHPLLIT